MASTFKKTGPGAGGKIGFYGVTPVVQPSGPDQAAVTLGNTDGEEFADDVRNSLKVDQSTRLRTLRASRVAEKLVKMFSAEARRSA